MLQRRIFMLKQRLNNVETIILFSETFRFPLDRAAYSFSVNNFVFTNSISLKCIFNNTTSTEITLEPIRPRWSNLQNKIIMQYFIQKAYADTTNCTWNF